MKMLHYRLFKDRPEIRHCVTMRDRSKKLDFSLALHTGQAAESIQANRRELEAYFGPGRRFVSVLQVHGDGICQVDEPGEKGWSKRDESVRADALLTDRPGVVLTILTADCVPILLYDPVRRVVGAVHAGWKGSRLGIVVRTVERMREAYGSRAEDILAAVGPAIGGCCYEVGPEVAAGFREYAEAVTAGEGENPHLDLKRVNRLQLMEAGVAPEHIEVSPVCTSCESERFFSYRKEGGCDGRFMSCIMIES